MITAHAVRAAVRESFDRVVSDLTDLVAIPSVSAAGHDPAQVSRSAEHVAALLRGAGFEAQVAAVPGPDGPGRPAVLAHRDGPADSPRVLLYAHHDVQPVGDAARWRQADPFAAERRGERLFGRGTADDGAGVIAHVHALRLLAELNGGELPCSVTVFIEGEEEVGSPSFGNFLHTYRGRLDADVIVVADSSNWKVGVPALTTSLRGVVQVDVRLDVLDHALHSGQYGGPVIDAVTAMCRLVSTLHDERGDVAVDGLISRPAAAPGSPDYSEADFRADAGVLEGVELAGTGDLTARLWTKPALAVIGMDVTPLQVAGNVLAPSCTARLSLRIAPGQDPAAALTALKAHLEEHVPFGARLTVTVGELGPAFDGAADTPAARAAHWALTSAFGAEAVNIGQGGSIPFIATLKETFPEAQVLVTGIEDPDTRAHSEDESMHLGDLEHIVAAEVLLLARLGGVVAD
ncbi:Acetylornithine deacetylase/Succinyl-diaminopimelate desuccinylase [Actinomyces ruminicola]|uniref:Acetylornithine deacetylase/Succinyl-diaminopimelate desuccinylase n=1 Tax=Actinomyces ruminicola TaxID=332524 RepID=A0A1H0CCV1_9ACTO|nr:M20/M25/M40 family metallo-hydrolase [Actinomyces ruminicola]SDN55744.1 Acetylornithine deacetylase/Succinyl-diaminopimelate desuccinylase [Actinomyces ruminicola]